MAIVIVHSKGAPTQQFHGLSNEDADQLVEGLTDSDNYSTTVSTTDRDSGQPRIVHLIRKHVTQIQVLP